MNGRECFRTLRTEVKQIKYLLKRIIFILKVKLYKKQRTLYINQLERELGIIETPKSCFGGITMAEAAEGFTNAIRLVNKIKTEEEIKIEEEERQKRAEELLQVQLKCPHTNSYTIDISNQGYERYSQTYCEYCHRILRYEAYNYESQKFVDIANSNLDQKYIGINKV